MQIQQLLMPEMLAPQQLTPVDGQAALQQEMPEIPFEQILEVLESNINTTPLPLLINQRHPLKRLLYRRTLLRLLKTPQLLKHNLLSYLLNLLRLTTLNKRKI